MKKMLILTAAVAVSMLGCGTASRTGTVIVGGPNGTAGSSNTGFFTGKDLTESTDTTVATPITTQTPANSRTVRRNVTSSSCLSLKKLSDFLRMNPNEPMMVNTYDLALGTYDRRSVFQYSNRDDIEINFLFAGTPKQPLILTAEHVSDILQPIPSTALLNPDDPTTFFNFVSQDVCNTASLSDATKAPGLISSPTAKSLQITMGTNIFIYSLYNNSIQVSTFSEFKQPATATVCSTSHFVLKNSYLFSFQKDMQTLHVAKNLFGLLSNHIDGIKDQLAGLKAGIMPVASYLLAEKNIAANLVLQADCATPK